jgi:hypothetical protein
MKNYKLYVILFTASFLLLTGCSVIQGLNPTSEETINPPLVKANSGVMAEGRVVPIDSAYLFRVKYSHCWIIDLSSKQKLVKQN